MLRALRDDEPAVLLGRVLLDDSPDGAVSLKDLPLGDPQRLPDDIRDNATLAQQPNHVDRAGTIDHRRIAKLAVGVPAPALDSAVPLQSALVPAARRDLRDSCREAVDVHRKWTESAAFLSITQFAVDVSPPALDAAGGHVGAGLVET